MIEWWEFLYKIELCKFQKAYVTLGLQLLTLFVQKFGHKPFYSKTPQTQTWNESKKTILIANIILQEF